MLGRLIVALVLIIMVAGSAAAQDKPPVRVPNLSVFNDGMEMIGALSALGLHGRITAMDAPSVELEGKVDQYPAAGMMLRPGGEVLIFKYGKYVPVPTQQPKTADTTGQPTSGMDEIVSGPDQAFIGTYAGTLKSPGGEQQVTVTIRNSGRWSLQVSFENGLIGTTGVTEAEETVMEGGVLVYRLNGSNHKATLSVKVSGDQLAGTLVVVSGTGEYAIPHNSVLTAARTQ